MAGWLYGAVALALNAVFLTFAFQGFIGRLGNPWARKVFRFSLVYLAGLFAAFWIDAVLHR
jgi:heme O synthase-like polyprenyltransferase